MLNKEPQIQMTDVQDVGRHCEVLSVMFLISANPIDSKCIEFLNLDDLSRYCIFFWSCFNTLFLLLNINLLFSLTLIHIVSLIIYLYIY